MKATDALIEDLKLWACSPRVPLKAQIVMIEAIGRLSAVPEALRSEDDPFAMQDAWNSAIDAAAMVAWNHEPDVDGPIETAIRALRLKPCAPSPQRQKMTSGKTTQPIEEGGAPFSTPGTIEP